MSIYYCKKTRRQFLVGSGKGLLALPLLPSLLPSDALAQATQTPRRMMLFWYDHNNLNSMWPSPTSTTTALTGGGREVLLSALGQVGSHSPALNNPRFQSLRDQITIVRGFDIEHGAGHGNGGLAAAMDRESEGNFPTIDTIIESAPSVYPQGTSSSIIRAVRISANGGMFFRKIGSQVERVPFYNEYEIRRFYNEVFSSLTGGTAPPQDLTNQLKSNILSRVMDSFNSLRTSNRISSDDLARVNQHMDYFSDLQRTYASIQPPIMTANCSRPADPGDIEDPLVYYRMYMNLMAIALKCGLTKFGVMSFEAHDPRWLPNLNTEGRGVHDVMHGGGGSALQLAVKTHWWRYFSNLVADQFLAPLEEMEGNTGRSYLDNMVTGLICQGGFAQPGGDGGHNGLDSQQILIGSMGGRVRTGRYMTVPRSQTGDNIYVGNNLPYNCFLITLLHLMGVPPSEYAYATSDGQGIGYYGAFSANHPRRSRFYQPVQELLTG